MIDTVILRIHDLKKHRLLLRHLDMDDKKGYSTEIGKIDSDDIERIRNLGVTKPSEIVSLLKMNRSGEFLMKSKVAKSKSSSDHYSFAWFVNHLADFVEINFSIPKFVYGSNILMFVDHSGDRDFNLSDGSNLIHNLGRCYPKLKSFFEQLWKIEFGAVKIDRACVEIFRIDVCFNQLFKTKRDALAYLEFQKRKRKKHSRDEEGVIRDYATSLMYVTQRFSAKIYHKGTEFDKNDRKQLEKLNKEKGWQYFRIDEYQALGDSESLP